MTKPKNPLWRFLASVKLALVLLLILAITSILGTLIKQGQAPEYYINEYGSGLAGLFETLDLTGMYSSWWYIALLALFAVNLIVCSCERLPDVWRQVTRDNLAVPPSDLTKLTCSHKVNRKIDPEKATERVVQALKSSGWRKIRRQEQPDSTLMFVQKGVWSRLGVYLVHLSILVVLAGAIIGKLFGFQAYVFIPEGRTTNHIFLRETREPMPIDFQVRCDRFEKTFYPNGMVKSYRADLTVLDPGLETPYRKSIIVNDPLSYNGLTFYMGDAYPTDNFLVTVTNQNSNQQQSFRTGADLDVNWPDMNLHFTIENLQLDAEGAVVGAGITFSTDSAADATQLWMTDQTSRSFEHGGQQFTLAFRQLQSVMLLIKKDPGITAVYSGCILLVIGLAVSFFFAHRRIWIRISAGGKKGTQIEIGGLSNKNRLGFEQRFQRLATQMEMKLDQKST